MQYCLMLYKFKWPNKQTNKQTKRANTQTNNQTDVLIETLYYRELSAHISSIDILEDL